MNYCAFYGDGNGVLDLCSPNIVPLAHYNWSNCLMYIQLIPFDVFAVPRYPFVSLVTVFNGYINLYY